MAMWEGPVLGSDVPMVAHTPRPRVRSLVARVGHGRVGERGAYGLGHRGAEDRSRAFMLRPLHGHTSGTVAT